MSSVVNMLVGGCAGDVHMADIPDHRGCNYDAPHDQCW